MYRFASAVASNLRSSRQKWTSQVRAQSSKVLSKESQHEHNNQPEQAQPSVYEGAKISSRSHKKLPPRDPLLKNLVIGKVDTSMMSFPEVVMREDMQKLQEEIQEIRRYFAEKLDIEKIGTTQTVGKEDKDQIHNFGLYGINIPQHLGGRGYTCSESLIAAEPETVCTDIATMLASHRLVVDVLQKCGTPEQIEKFLPILASETGAATEALYERTFPQGEGIMFFHTKATYDEFDKQWMLNGEKAFVVNGKDAKFFLVVAETEKLNRSGEMASGVTLFMVDGTLAGIKRSSDLSPLGCRGSDMSTITFDSVRVDENCIIGEVNAGTDVALDLIRFHRLRMSLVTSGLMKNLINHISRYCIITKHSGVPLKDMDIIGLRLSRLVCKTYALEAMVYYTAGLIDEFNNQDVDLEIAATKLFSLDCLQSASTAPVDFMGPVSLLSDQPTHAIVTNAIQLYTLGESKDTVSLYTGLLGLQYAGMNIHDVVKKERNALLHPVYMMGKLFERATLDNPKVRWRLNEQIHPSLDMPSKQLEQSIGRLKMSTEMLLTRYGTDVLEKHGEVTRLAEIVSLVYAMFATLSRASRSHCIGLRHSDYEVALSVTICAEASNRVKLLSTEIGDGPFCNNDRNHLKIAKQIYKSKGFFPEHPTTYNY